LQDAHKVVLAEKPPIKDTSLRLPPDVRDELLAHLASLASVYHKLPHTFVRRQRAAVERAADLEARRAAAEAEANGVAPSVDLAAASGGLSGGTASGASPVTTAASGEAVSGSTAVAPAAPSIDLLGGLDEPVRCEMLCASVAALGLRVIARVPRRMQCHIVIVA
jgi:AP-1 complex subunit beta-1